MPIPLPAPLPDNAIRFGKVKALRNGRVQVSVAVTGPGRLVAQDARTKASAARTRKKAAKALVGATGVGVASGAQTVTVTLKPTATARKALASRGRVTARVRFTYTPAGGIANSVTRALGLKVVKKRKR